MERRIAADGQAYTRAEFAEWYHGESAAEQAWERARIAWQPASVAVTDPTGTPEQARSGLATEQALTALPGLSSRTLPLAALGMDWRPLTCSKSQQPARRRLQPMLLMHL